MTNRIRGEVPLALGGQRYTLCLTLGALAELETALQAGDLAGLAERFAGGRASTRDLIALLGVALRGGGHALDDAAVARLPLAGGLDAVTAALGEVLMAAFGEAPGPANPPQRRRPPPGGRCRRDAPGARPRLLPRPLRPGRRSPGTTPWRSASACCAGGPGSSGPRPPGNSRRPWAGARARSR